MSEEQNTQSEDSKAEAIDPAKYQEALERARRFEAQAVDREKQLERYRNIDPDEYHALKDSVFQYQKKEATTDPAKIDELVQSKAQELEEAYKQQFTEKDSTIQTLEGELKELRVVDRAMSKATSIFNDDALPLIKEEIRKHCDFVDGEIVIREGEKLARSKSNPSENMGVEEFLTSLAEKYPSCARPKGVTGTRRPGEQVSGNFDSSTITLARYQEMTNAERAKLDPKTRQRFAAETLKGVSLVPQQNQRQ